MDKKIFQQFNSNIFLQIYAKHNKKYPYRCQGGTERRV